MAPNDPTSSTKDPAEPNLPKETQSLENDPAPETSGEDAAPQGEVDDATAQADTPRDPLSENVAEEDLTSPTDETFEDESHSDSEGGSNLAARMLTWLVLLLAGGGIALWGAPRIAPNLPDGLGPVKAWLMPGESLARQDIAALRAEVEARLAALADSDDTAAQIEAVRTDLSTQITQSVAGVSDEVDSKLSGLSETLTDAIGSDLAERMAALETQITGIDAELDSLTGALTGVQAEGISDEAQAQIAGFIAAVQGLKAEVADLAEREGATNARIDQVAALAETRIVEAEEAAEKAATEARTAETLAAQRAVLSALDAKARAGVPFDEVLAAFNDVTDVPVPEALSAVAPQGIPSAQTLRSRFGYAASDAIKAGVRETAATEGGLGARLGAFLTSQVATRSLDPQEGDDTNAVLSRAQAAVNADNYAEALAEVETLTGAAAQTMAPWATDARNRLAALAALDALAEALAPTN